LLIVVAHCVGLDVGGVLEDTDALTFVAVLSGLHNPHFLCTPVGLGEKLVPLGVSRVVVDLKGQREQAVVQGQLARPLVLRQVEK